MTSDERFNSVVEALQGRTDVAVGYMFGSPGLKVGGKVFSMLVKGMLVVKLPRPRVEALIASGSGEYFDPGHGRPSKEWVAIQPNDEPNWLAVSEEAMNCQPFLPHAARNN